MSKVKTLKAQTTETSTVTIKNRDLLTISQGLGYIVSNKFRRSKRSKFRCKCDEAFIRTYRS